MKTEMKSSLKLFMRPLLVVLAFMLLYALVHVALGFYVKKTALNKPKCRKNRDRASKRRAFAQTRRSQRNHNCHRKKPHQRHSAAFRHSQRKNKKLNKSKKKENEPKQDSVPPVQNNQKPLQPP